MTTRLYLSNWAPGYTPATVRGAWDATAATVARYASTGPGQGAATTSAQAETSATNNWDVFLGRWISAPLRNSGTIAGNVTGVIGALESNASANEVLHVHIYVTTGDSDTPRGTLLTDSIGAVEFPTTAAGITFASTALSSLAITAGDRIVVEIGSQSQEASATSRTSTIRYGGTSGTDLANAGTSTANPGWLEFSDTNAVLAPIISPVGALASASGTGTTTLAVTTVNVGDLVVVGTWVDGGTVTVTGVSGSKTTGWTRIVGPLQGTGAIDQQDMWMGTVTSAGSETLTFTTSGSVAALDTAYAAKQFTSKFGTSTTWAIDGSQTAGTMQTASTTVTFPTLTAAATGELYVGYAVPANTGQVGSTAEFQYEIDSFDDIFIYSTNIGTSALAPTATQSSSGIAARMAAIVKASAAGATATAGLSTANATGLAPTASISAPTGLASANATGRAPAASISVNAGLASANATGLGPAVNVNGAVAIPTGLATANATALAPAASISVNAGLATANATGRAAVATDPAGDPVVRRTAGFLAVLQCGGYVAAITDGTGGYGTGGYGTSPYGN